MRVRVPPAAPLTGRFFKSLPVFYVHLSLNQRYLQLRLPRPALTHCPGVRRYLLSWNYFCTPTTPGFVSWRFRLQAEAKRSYVGDQLVDAFMPDDTPEIVINGFLQSGRLIRSFDSPLFIGEQYTPHLQQRQQYVGPQSAQGHGEDHGRDHIGHGSLLHVHDGKPGGQQNHAAGGLEVRDHGVVGQGQD